MHDDEANRNMNVSDLFRKTSKMEMIGGGGKNRIRDTFFNRIEMTIDVDFSVFTSATSSYIWLTADDGFYQKQPIFFDTSV